jgi:3-oxoacyl-[acyl-carrier protein] reductase
MPTPSTHAFAEKVALITDGASPIGRAAALQLALYGCYAIVGFSDEREENFRALNELKSLGTLANAVKADVSTVEGAKNLVGEVEKMFGRIDLLVNCLKFASDSKFEESTEEDFDKTIAVNLKSIYFITQAALPLMRQRPKPKIVNVVYACDDQNFGQNLAFAASQKAVTGFTESLAATLPKNFRVNAVEISENGAPAENLDAELFRPKTGVSADDAARTILFLLSSESTGLNGQILKVV